MSSNDPILAASREILELALVDMCACVDAASVDALNWRPAGDDTNSIAVLAVHSLHSTRSWLSVAVGASLPKRERAAEFVASASDAAALVATVDAMKRDCMALLDGAKGGDWSVMRKYDAEEVTAAWALLHALEHLREHVGQMLLTRQLWDARKT